MNETKQPAQLRDNTVSRTAFWGTIALSVIDCLLCSYFFWVLSQQTKTPITYAAMAVFLLAILTAVSSFVLTLNLRQGLAAKLLFCIIFVIGISAVTLYEGRTLSASLSILLIAIMVIRWLLPVHTPRLRYMAFAFAVFTLMWVINWIDPAWRTTLEAVTMGPLATGVFAVVLAWIVFKESRSFLTASMRNKLVAAFVAISFFAVSAVGAVTNFVATDQLDVVLENNFSELATRMAKETGDTVVNSKTALDGLVLNKFIQDTVESANLSGTSDLGALARLDETWGSASDNHSLIVGVLNNDLAGELRELQARLPQYSELFVTDRNGAVIASTDRTSDYYQADEKWWQSAWNEGQGKVYISHPIFDDSVGIYAVEMALPIPAHNRSDIVGVLRATVNITELTDVLSVNEFGQTGQAVLIFPNHQYITREIGTYLNSLNAETLSAIESLQAGFGEISYDGVESLASKAPVTTSNPQNQEMIDELDWTIVIHQDLSEARAPVAATTRSVIYIAIAVLIGAVVLAFYVGGQFVKPVENLTTIAEKLAAGDLSARAAETSQDEIGALARTFNRMGTQLHDVINSLEQRVADRTRNLELAAEVGRAVSQVRALDVMLRDACELIMKEFNLYYVQVYLTDATGSTLKLEAGTGNVGAQLVGRGHSLPLDSSSINGRAAIDKHSVVISDTAQSTVFRKNPLLPDTRGEMAVPLIVAGKVVGVLDMQSSQSGVLNNEILPAFETLAGQLAIAVQNANLLAETEHARAEVEKQARRLVRTSWNEHLDAVHKPEQIAYVFDRKEVRPLTEPAESQTDQNSDVISSSISVTGERLGSLVIEMNENSRTDQAAELVSAVSRQVAQQIENLRLLESAERYRHEAEQSIRRQTRENWQEYFNAEGNSTLSYLYNLNEVRPHHNGYEVNESSYTLPLKVRDEAIGKLAIQGLGSDDDESINLINAVADRLTAHIEGLRQTNQTQSALAQSEKLFDASRSLTQSTDLQQLVNSTVSALNIPAINRAILVAFDYDTAGNLEGLDVIANWWNGTGHQATQVGTHYPLEVIRVMSMFVSPTPVFFNDAFNDERVDTTTMQLVQQLNLRAVAVLPLHVGTTQLGALVLEAEEPHNFTTEETRLFIAIAPQIATIVDNRRQFERAQKQAQREATLNVINQKIQSATSVEAVLQIAARELGHALGAPMTIAQLSMKDRSS